MATSAITNENTLIRAAEASARSAANSSATSASGTSSSTAALTSLADNYTTFLTLLTTQLQHQDPSSPMSSDTFTQELAQFAGVEQQVQTNKNLASLISLNEGSQLTSDASLVGQTATANTTTLPLQNGSASLSFEGSSGQTVAIAVANSAGVIVKDVVASASNGTNTWTWDGTDNNGNQLSNGAYSVAVETVSSSGTTSDVPFTVSGTITGVAKGDSDMEVEMGDAHIPLSDVTNVSSATTSTGTNSGSTGS
ncbi:flagellar biosynthesis protein FlgD [Gluconacetobacter azotocaptans]|uniref:Basal-body rod modification protein FlgD n=1 Tax=Gluconacetobacter azotocaptans TaxID=142834 RepID=A0A7W4JR87_9PROT|nr:flagellar hook capping FlgD N-terminal domain-containing protein [Gluconacetobacter azotocaptans]MBB2189416.1 flagellar biosynthesis protein FlgD [Gluconacetobacter azotocaptans]MBM9401189.1 flagellar biosynthesis protein FlgD [Gluconacetobacter azotocaptans]GBQ34530.1 basal-body rod modification protein FlgD [Gluconacetobacter azotocaptans DSM 13594]